MKITFKSDVKKRRTFFTPEAFAHPAKMHLGMLLWIIGKYTEVGETILDPMFGCGSTMLAARLGRNVVGVELEEKFVQMAGANRDKLQTLPSAYPMGNCQIIQGDARQLEGLVDKIVTSPPYAETITQGGNTNAHKAKYGYQGRNIGYAEAQNNIGNLPYGQIDKIVTSPPYADAQVPPHTAEGEARRLEIAKERGVSPDKVSYMDYTKKVDSIITSPPYELMAHGTAESKVSSGFKSEAAKKIIEGQARGYSEAPNNIGNLKNSSYLEAMLQVYKSCYDVLKPNGLMILVTKDFIRKGQRILLSIDTMKLCEQAGFVFEDWHERVLTQQSFWRVIYYKKYPEVERLETEDILVFRKPQ